MLSFFTQEPIFSCPVPIHMNYYKDFKKLEHPKDFAMRRIFLEMFIV